MYCPSLHCTAIVCAGVLMMHADDYAVSEEGQARAQAEAAALGETEHTPAGHHLAARRCLPLQAQL